MVSFYRNEAEWVAIAERLKSMPCPHCGCFGTLNRHGTLRSFDDSSPPRKTIHARRIFCSNRGRKAGCGRTFSIWLADKIRRLGLGARLLWQFLERASTGTLADAIRRTTCPFWVRTMQRIWRRFVLGQSRIRTALAAICSPPTLDSHRPEAQVIAHLQAAFPESTTNPIADFQAKTGTFFV